MMTAYDINRFKGITVAMYSAYDENGEISEASCKATGSLLCEHGCFRTLCRRKHGRRDASIRRGAEAYTRGGHR